MRESGEFTLSLTLRSCSGGMEDEKREGRKERKREGKGRMENPREGVRKEEKVERGSGKERQGGKVKEGEGDVHKYLSELRLSFEK